MSNPEKSKFPPPTEVPTQEGPHGIRYDFNQGFRLLLPVFETERWHIKVWDADAGTMVSDRDYKGGPLNSTKRYFIRFGMEIKLDDQVVFEHIYDARDHEVLILFPEGTIGDTVAWMAYATTFAERHGCQLTLRVTEKTIPLFAQAYPSIHFCFGEDECRVESKYATYYVGLFGDDRERKWNPVDYKITNLAHIAGYILGFVNEDVGLPKITTEPSERPIADKYVCIAAQSTAGAKMWLNPYGWMQTVRQLKHDGYRVICIDESIASGDAITWNFAPPGVEDETGSRPLLERVRWLTHCELFIGLSSGLSWLAWALGKPVVLISGFTHPSTEFYTPYRVINLHACNSCWNEHQFPGTDFLWCPRHKGTPRHFECSHSISSHHVMRLVRTIPGYQGKPEA